MDFYEGWYAAPIWKLVNSVESESSEISQPRKTSETTEPHDRSDKGFLLAILIEIHFGRLL